MKTEDIIKKITSERNSSENTCISYRQSIALYEKYNNKPLSELIEEAQLEEKDAVRWNNSTLKNRLMDFRSYLYIKYKQNSARLHLTIILSTYRHMGVEVQPLPYFSQKQVKTNPPIYYDDLPDKQVLRRVIGVCSPFIKAVTLFMSSSGCSRIDTLNLKLTDYLLATREYHHQNNIYDAIQTMQGIEYQIIPIFYLKRQKTGKPYFTFCSDEAVRAINDYLLTRDLTKSDKLFKCDPHYFNHKFRSLNDELGLGEVGDYGRFRPHMLRKYHASRLYEAGMDKYKVDQLQGRSKEKVQEAYFKDSPSSLKEEYIKCLPNLVVNDYEEVKTELEASKEENQKLSTCLEDKEIEVENMNQRLQSIEEILFDPEVRSIVNRFKK